MKVSVIIPVYNGAEHLAACLESVRKAGKCISEVIVVDDGSCDGTAETAEKLAEADRRIRVVHTANHGSYEARRTGIALAEGECMAFIDADDCFCEGALDCLAELMEKTGADVVMGRILHEGLPGHRGKHHDVPGAPEVRRVRKKEMWRRIMKWRTQEFVCYAVNKLYRRRLFRGLVPGEGICQGDDVLLTCQVFLKAGRIAETSAPVYRYRATPGSLTRSGFGDRDLDLMKVWDLAVLCMPEGKLRYMARMNRWRTDFTLLCRLLLDGSPEKLEKYREYSDVWRASLAAHWKEFLRARNMPVNRLLLYLFLRFAFGPAKQVLRTGKVITG